MWLVSVIVFIDDYLLGECVPLRAVESSRGQWRKPNQFFLWPFYDTVE